MLKYFCGAPTKIYLHEHLTHEYFHTLKFPDLWYLALFAVIMVKYSYITWNQPWVVAQYTPTSRCLCHGCNHVIIITWLPCFHFVCIWWWLSQRYQTGWCKNSQWYWIPHQPRKYHFAEWSFGSKGERQSFKAVWFDTWWWLSYQEVSDSVINFHCSQASNQNMMMKGLYGR